ncbi:DUF2550 domain-containing protein [Acidipropionibacterium thoenii]|uniref:DUF2550 domain-containing protein n=1 Tax=Acidipropionibacterium thoenii TaxID=1751 RepID=UPI000687D286|nr:DUF2550 domain-containing protein [Acidipropionibacterium thoenii]
MAPFSADPVVAMLSGVGFEFGLVLLVVAVGMILVMGWLLIRHQLLLRRRGVFVCGLRLLGRDRSGGQRASAWMLGVAQYCGGDFKWYRPINPLLTPSLVMHRGELAMVEHHRPTPSDDIPFLLGSQVVTLSIATGGKWSRCQVVLDQQILTGMMSWLEAAPPGGANCLTARTI